jgi:hypothetical protein
MHISDFCQDFYTDRLFKSKKYHNGLFLNKTKPLHRKGLQILVEQPDPYTNSFMVMAYGFAVVVRLI